MTQIFNRIAAAYTRHKKYSATVSELRRLTDRELADLGIARADIHEIAVQSI